MSETNVAEAANEEVHQESEAEVKARRLGWVPKEEFKGDPDKHRSAEEFLDRGINLLPLLQRDNDKLHRGIGKLEKQLEEQSRTFEEFRQHSEQARETALKRQKAELEAKLDNAIQTADVDAARQTRREIAALDEERKPVVPEKRQEDPKPALDPVFQGWIAENDWFNKSPVLKAVAIEEFGELERAQPGRNPSELLAEAKKKVMERFPDKFGINPRREGAAAVAAPNGSAAPPRKKGKSYEDLPPEAKRACDKFVKTIKNYTKEQYVKDYDWD